MIYDDNDYTYTKGSKFSRGTLMTIPVSRKTLRLFLHKTWNRKDTTFFADTKKWRVPTWVK